MSAFVISVEEDKPTSSDQMNEDVLREALNELHSEHSKPKDILSPKDKQILRLLPEVVLNYTENPTHNAYGYDGCIDLYDHREHGYVFTTAATPACGIFQWFSITGESLHVSPVGYWAKPSKDCVEKEK